MWRSDIIISEGSNGLSTYEELLLQRDSLSKQGEQYLVSYYQIFGDLLVEAFELRIECIRKKKIIAYCQQQVNHGKAINGSALDRYIHREMAAYESDLKDLMDASVSSKASRRISEYDSLRIKKIYHSLAKLIHPDLHPEFENDPVIAELWSRIVVAYQCNHLQDLEELDFQVKKYLENRGDLDFSLVVPDLENKISALREEIDEIISTDPYLYGRLLEDDEAVEGKKEELYADIKAFRDYSAPDSWTQGNCSQQGSIPTSCGEHSTGSGSAYIWWIIDGSDELQLPAELSYVGGKCLDQ